MCALLNGLVLPSPSWLSCFALRPKANPSERLSLMNCHVVRFLTLYEVLGLHHRRVMYVTLERRVGNDLPQNDTTNFVGFRVPFDMVTALECLGHSGFVSEPISGEGSLPPAQL